MYILLTKITAHAAQNEVALSYDRERELYCLAAILVATTVTGDFQLEHAQ